MRRSTRSMLVMLFAGIAVGWVPAAGAQTAASNVLSFRVVVQGTPPSGAHFTMSAGCEVISSEAPPPSGLPTVEFTAEFDADGAPSPQAVEVPMPVSTGDVLCAVGIQNRGIDPGTPYELHLGCTTVVPADPDTPATTPTCFVSNHGLLNVTFHAPGAGAVVDFVQELDFSPIAPPPVELAPAFTG